MALDIVQGPVLQVIDGDTFDMQVDRIGTHNGYEYNGTERIRIQGIDAPELGTRGGSVSTDSLRRILAGRIVRCHVHARDSYRRLVSDVEMM